MLLVYATVKSANRLHDKMHDFETSVVALNDIH